jgi:alditol oxidase
VRNWAGSHTYGARTLHRPSTVDEARSIVARTRHLRVLGSRHSFTDIADSDELIALDGLPAAVEVDREAGSVSVPAGMTYGALAEVLKAEGVALHNLASLPHISIGGAIATGTHGSGDRSGGLATAVAGLELVTSDGDVLTLERGDAGFDGAVVALGAAGAVIRVTLDVEPAYEVRQRVFEGLPWEAVLGRFDEVTAAGASVSVFTTWGETAGTLWVKSRVTDAPETVRAELFRAVATTGERNPIPGADPAACTPQLGVPGAWSDRLPHFRMDFRPIQGEELQSEYFVARRHALAAIEVVRGLADRVRPLLLVSEIRTVAADGLWMSPCFGRDSVALHFTWRRERDAVERVLADVEAALAPLDARPHWGKLFLAGAEDAAARYERLPDFAALVGRLDPRGAFRNDWLARHVYG